MAFGDVRPGGTLSLSGASVGTNNALTGSVVVFIGDLVLVNFAQQTNLTASGVTDNLGNTYTAANAGSDGGVITGRFFYSRVTVPGTLTTVTVAATSSANDFAGVAVVLEGHFNAADLLGGTTPANTTADLTSPFDCPSSGALDTNSPALKKVVVGWAVHDNNVGWSATSPDIKVAEVNRANANAIISARTVTGTSAVAPQFTGTNPAAIVLGTISFNEEFKHVFQPPISEPTLRKIKPAALIVASGLLLTPVQPEPVVEFTATSAEILVPYSKTLLYQSTFESYFPIVEEERTVDKWHRPLSEPTRRKVSFVNHPSVFRTDISYPGADETRVSSTEIVVPYSKTLIYQSYFDGYFPVVVVEDIFPDKWHTPLSEPTLRKPFQAEALFVPPSEVLIRPDHWYPKLNEPTRRTVSRANIPVYFEPPTDLTVRPDFYWRPLSEPTRRKSDLTTRTFFFEPPSELLRPDKWFRQLSEPTRRTISRANVPVYFEPPTDLTVNVDFYFRQLSEPTRRKVNVVNLPTYFDGYFPVVVVEDVFPDKWLVPLAEPTRRKVEVTRPVYFEPPTDLTVNIDFYFRQLSEPVRRKVRVTNLPTDFYAVPIIIRSDTWYRPLEIPVRRKSDLTTRPFFFEPPSELIRPDKWFVQLSVPTRREPTLYPDGHTYSYFFEIVTVDKYQRPLSTPVLRITQVQPDGTTFTYFVENAPGNNDTDLDEYYHPLQLPTRRMPTIYPPGFSYGTYETPAQAPDTEIHFLPFFSTCGRLKSF